MIKLKGFILIGLALGEKTTNEKGQSATDCGKLWQRFLEGGFADKIPGKIINEVFAVYHNYEGDYTKPYSYFIGCKVKSDAKIPEGMNRLEIAGSRYQLFKSYGKMPDCIGKTWEEIWKSDIPRAYLTDFEVYGEKSQDLNNAEIDIFISVT